MSAHEDWREAPRHRIAVLPHYAYRFASTTGRRVTPQSGFGVSGTFETVYWRPSRALDAALGIDFSYDRFAQSEVSATMAALKWATYGLPRVTSETSFVLVHTAATRWRALRPYFTVGVGVGFAYFYSATFELRPGTARPTHPLGHIAVGTDVSIKREWSLSVRAEYTAVRGTRSMVTEEGETLALFGDLLAVCAGMAYRF